MNRRMARASTGLMSSTLPSSSRNSVVSFCTVPVSRGTPVWSTAASIGARGRDGVPCTARNGDRLNALEPLRSGFAKLKASGSACSTAASTEVARNPSAVGEVPSFRASLLVTLVASAIETVPIGVPLWAMARLNSPFADGIASRSKTLSPPADCPQMVTSSGSPPNAAMLRLHPLQRRDLVAQPEVVGALPEVDEALDTEPVVDRDVHDARLREGVSAVGRARRPHRSGRRRRGSTP